MCAACICCATHGWPLCTPPLPRLLQLVQLGCSAHLLDPAFALLCSQFYITYCVWLTMQFEACKQVSTTLTMCLQPPCEEWGRGEQCCCAGIGRAACVPHCNVPLGVLQAVASEEELQSALATMFCQIPLYPLKDMEKWFHFLIIFDSQLLAGLPVRLGICLCTCT